MRRRGLTLLETLLALAVAALVLAAVQAAVVRVAAARTRATAAADRVAAARTLLLRIATELEAARADAPGAARFLVEPREGRAGAGAALRFVTAAPVPAAPGRPASDLREVRYDLEPDARRPGRDVLVRREAEPLAAGEAPAVVVLEDVRRLVVRAFDGVAWHAAWEPGRLPHAVEVALTLGGDGGGETLGTAVALPAARGR